MPEPASDMLRLALEAYDAGLCVVRAKADGSKRPDGQWRQYQAERPSREQVASWFKDGHPAMGTICGAVSGDLEMFELEGRFVEKYTISDFKQRMKDAGLELLLARLTNGIITQSPSGGWHFLYRITDGQADGNTKLAGTAESLTLIETRGEGGFVMLPPSHGTTHPSGKPWKLHKGGYGSIPSITSDEREALFDVARSYDESPATKPIAPVDPGQRVPHQRYTASEFRESWIAMVEEHLRATWEMQQLLERYGWSFLYQDRHGRQLMHRPGKDGDGVGGSINLSDRFHPFSSSTPFPDASAGKKAPTWDRIGVIATYEYGGDRMAALNEIARTTGILGAWKQAKDAELHREMDALTEPQPPLHVNADGEVTRPADDAADESLWYERDALTHILQAARSRLVGPYAVLGCVLARVAAFTPPSTSLPPTIGGGTTPLSLYIALRARSGGGKSSPAACANDLLPDTPAGCVGPLALGSGEGLVEAFMELSETTDGAGKKVKVKKQTKSGALFMLDEGQMLAEIGSRKGSTILPVLRTAWSGADPGQANASIETRRSLRAGSYAVGLISLWQDRSGAALIADADGGTPQRFVWLPTTDPGASKDRPAWPGPLKWEAPPVITFPTPLELHPDIIDEIVEGHIAVALHATAEIDPLDAHRRLNKLKVAGCLAVLDGRRDVSPDDWRIAERIMTLSDQQRDWVIAESRREAANKMSTEIAKAVMKEGAVEKSATERALRNAARAVYRAAESSPDGATKRSITIRIASRDRALVTVDDAIAEALRLRWVEGNDTVGYRIGEAKPA
jgi:hypothetical protein